MDAAFYRARRTKILQMIENIDDVLLKLSINPRASYSIDTGQGRETVTTANASMFRTLQKNLISDLEEIENILDGTGLDPQFLRPRF